MVDYIATFFISLIGSGVGCFISLSIYYSKTVEVEYPLEPPSYDNPKHKPIRMMKKRKNVEEIRKELVEAHNDWMYDKPRQME